MENLSVGGLVSGIDTNAIIDGLSNLEQLKVSREEKVKADIETKKEAFNDLVSRIGGLATKAEALDDEKAFNIFTPESNDDTVVTLSGSEDALPGEYTIDVQSLASAQKVGSAGFTAFNTGLGITGSFEVSRSKAAIESDPTKTFTQIDLSSTDSLKDIVRKINATEGSGVNASILSLADNEHRIVLTGKDEGSDSFFLKDISGSPLGSAGLGFTNDTQKVRSEFNFVSTTGGALTSTSTLDQMVTNIGSNNLTSGDTIQISGTDAQGNAVASTAFSFDPATNTIQDLLTAIESAYGNVSATLNSSGEIVLTDTSSGTSEMTLNLNFVDSDSSGSTMTLGSSKVQNSFNNIMQEGTKAFFLLDGMSVSTQTNSDDNLINGTSINLKKADPGNSVKVSIKRNYAGIKDNIQAFVDQYNSVLKFIDDKSKVQISDAKKDGTDKKQKVDSRGPFAGDAIIRRVRNELQRTMTSPIEELEGRTVYSSLARVGITSNKTTGLLETDGTKLEDALKTDFEGVRSLFMASGYSPDNPSFEYGRHTDDTKTGTYQIDTATDEFDSDASSGTSLATGTRTGEILLSSTGDSKGLSVRAPTGSGSGSFVFTRGLASQIKLFNDNANDYANGLFKETRNSFDKRISSSEDRIEKLTDQVASFKARLIKQFSDMEQSMSRLQSQSSAFMSQISAL